MIEVVEVTSGALADEFVAVGERVRGGVPVSVDEQTVRELLAGTHRLSSQLDVRGFVARRGGEVVGRIATTLSDAAPGRTQLGLFECVDDQAVADALLGVVDGPVVGPVDASFWLSYRLRTDGFNQTPFVGEPHNPDWYPRLWQGAGFTAAHTYVSRTYRPEKADEQQIGATRLFGLMRQQFEAAGYEFRVPTAETMDDELRTVHGLISELYADFPLYHPISADDFLALMAPMRQVVAPEHITVAYHEGEPAGFQVTVPDAHVVDGRRRFTSLYSGAKRAHKGLGKALLLDFARFCLENEADAIGALVHEGKVTGSYAPELVIGTSTHVLYERG